MPKEPGLSPGVAAVVLTVVIANLGNNIVSPLIPAIKDQFGSTAAQVSLMVSGFGLGRLAMDLPAGFLTDRVGPARLFAIGILLSGAAAALATLSTSLQQLIVFRTAMGFGSAIMSTVALTLLARIAPPGQRGAVLGFYTSAMLFGQAISPTIGGYLGTVFDWRAAFVFCALTPFISFPMNILVTSRTDAVKRPIGGDSGKVPRSEPGVVFGPTSTTGLDWPALTTVYLGTFVNFFNRHGMRNALLPLYAGMVLGLDPGFIGAVLTTGSVFTILINLPSGSLADRIGKKLLLIPGLLTLVVGNLCVLLGGSSTLVFVVATVLISMGVLSNSMLTALVADLVPERLAGRGMGMYRFTSDLGAVLGPITLGLIVDSAGFPSAVVVGAGVVLLGLTAVLLFLPRHVTPSRVDRTA